MNDMLGWLQASIIAAIAIGFTILVIMGIFASLPFIVFGIVTVFIYAMIRENRKP